MDKKYELLKDDFIKQGWRNLYRIKALKDFGDIKVGDIGGYIESEANLSHEDNCWIYDNAYVFGNARVFDNAMIYDNAYVFGDARVYDNAMIYDNAEVCDNARVYNNAEVYGNARVFNNAKVYGNAEVYGDAEVYHEAHVYENAKIYGDAKVHGYAEVCGNAIIQNDIVIGQVSLPFKDVLQFQCKHRMLTAILTENNEILYSIGCQNNITEEEFIERIHNENRGLEKNPHRAEYLRLIKTINFHFKGE